MRSDSECHAIACQEHAAWKFETARKVIADPTSQGPISRAFAAKLQAEAAAEYRLARDATRYAYLPRPKRYVEHAARCGDCGHVSVGDRCERCGNRG